MSALPRIAKAPDGQGVSAPGSCAATPSRARLEIPPPIPTASATLEQIRNSLELGLAQANAGLTEDADDVQARMRAKYGVRSR